MSSSNIIFPRQICADSTSISCVSCAAPISCAINLTKKMSQFRKNFKFTAHRVRCPLMISFFAPTSSAQLSWDSAQLSWDSAQLSWESKANARSVNLRDSLFSVRKRNLDFYLLNLKKFLIYDIIVKKDFFSRRYKIVSRTKIDSINISFSNFKIYLKNRNFSKFEVMENFQTNIYKNLQ